MSCYHRNLSHPAPRTRFEMKYFARALKQAWRHWPALLIGIFCSVAVAALWGANIAAIFPIIQTTLNGESLQSWNQKRIDAAQTSLTAHEAEVDGLAKKIAAATAEPDKRELTFQLEMAQSRIKVDQASLYSARRLQPYIVAYMPSKPFATVVLVTIVVAIATALKQLLMLIDTMLVTYVSQSIARDIRGQIFDKSLSLDQPAFDRQGISGFTAHITHTTDMLATGITNVYGGAVTEPLRIVACLGGAWAISWRLTLASLIFSPLAAFFILYLNRKIRAISLGILTRSMGFHHVMLEVFNSLLTVHANTMEDFERDRFRQSTGHMRRTALKATFYHALANPVTEFLGMGMLCTGIV